MRKEIAVLTNPTSGKGKGSKVATVVVPRLTDAGFAVRSLTGRDAEEATGLARQAVADGVETLVVIGGDGMVHLAAQELANSSTRLGLVPAGTGNDVARAIGVPRNDPIAATDIIIGGKVRALDLAKIGRRYYVTVLAAGFDAIVNERANEMTWPKGQMRYNLATLAELRTFSPIPYVLEVDGEQHRFDAMMVAVGNTESFGGGMQITKGAVPDDGVLDVVAIMPMSKVELIRTFPKLFSGAHVHHPKYRHFSGRSITVAAPGIVAYADGERMTSLPLTVDVVPQALRVLVP